MPWPQNSRTTEKPLRLGEGLDAVADVAQRAPGFTFAMPFHIAS